MAIDNNSTLKNINNTIDAYKSVKDTSSEIKKRLKGVPEKDVQKTVYKLVDDGDIIGLGAKKNRKYDLVKKK